MYIHTYIHTYIYRECRYGLCLSIVSGLAEQTAASGAGGHAGQYHRVLPGPGAGLSSAAATLLAIDMQY